MPKPKNNDLVHFQNFMLENLGLSKRSSYVYASRVRWMLRQLEGGITAEKVAQLIQNTGEHSRASNYVSAWNRFREFFESKGVTIPIASSSLADLRAKQQYLPPNVLHSLLEILRLSRLPIKDVPFIRWKGVNIRKAGQWEIRDICDPHSYYMCPRDHTRTLCNWANEEEDVDDDRPLVPAFPLSMEPMPLRTLYRFRRAFAKTFYGLNYNEMKAAFSDEARIRQYRHLAF